MMTMEQPKKPTGGAFGMFLQERRSELEKQEPNKTAMEIKHLGFAVWKQLLDTEQEGYQKLFEEALQKYESDHQAFLAAGGGQEDVDVRIAACLSDERFLPPVPLRAQRTFSTVTVPDSDLDLRSIIVNIFRTSTLGSALIGDDQEHMLTALHKVFGLGENLHRPDTHSPFKKAYQRITQGSSCTPAELELSAQFHRALKCLARDVFAPLLGVGPDEVLYQALPVLRISHPSPKATGVVHTDYISNHHQPAEINFWIPMNRCFGANTLYVESAPGVGDYSAVELEYGEALMFWGNQVRHHTLPNSTDTTRVSLDLRAMARHTFNPNFVDSRGQLSARRIGEFYLSTCSN